MVIGPTPVPHQDEILRALEEVRSRFPPHCVEVLVAPTETATGRGTLFRFKPTSDSDSRADLRLELDESGEVAYVGLGRDSRLEIALEQGWRDPQFDSSQEQIIEVAEAVARGNFVENLWLRRGYILKSVGILEVSRGRRVEMSARHTVLPLRFCSRETLEFRPYC